MRFVFLLFFSCVLSYASELITYHVYDRNDRVDLMLSFDSAYNGRVTQEKKNNFTLVTLNDLTYSKEEIRKINSSLIEKIQISSKNNKTYIMFQNKENVRLELGVINDKFGMRIRALPDQYSQADSLKISKTFTPSTSEELMPKSKNIALEGYDYTNYILVLVALLILLIFLWWFKRILSFKNQSFVKGFKIIFQKPLDRNNQFMILDYADKRYIMIIGNSNVLLDTSVISEDMKFSSNQDEKEQNFESFFEENKRKIQNLIQKNQKDKI